MIKITIIRPNGYKMWFNLSHEELEAWGEGIKKLGDLTCVKQVEFNFQKEEDKRNLSET